MNKPACPMCEKTDVLEFPGHWECATCGCEWDRTPEPEVPKDAQGKVVAEGDGNAR